MRIVRENLFLVSLLFSGSPKHSLAHRDVTSVPHLHMWSCVLVFKDASCVGYEAQPTPVRPHLNELHLQQLHLQIRSHSETLGKG